ncbi:MAG TPA: ribose-phosphate diphosphokinase [Candidatus Nanoarchaeia archaeon]|nr:ribose-phosphate diphosphokinase [Candidatus Nanoarchaeia archaeon]
MVLILSFPETEALGKAVARSLKAPYATVKNAKFPDGEYNLSLKQNPSHQTVILISSMAHHPNAKLIETLLVLGMLKDYGAKKIILIATYLPYMRQDTHFFNYDSFSSKHILELFSNLDKLIVIDPHLHRLHSMRQLSSKASSITVNHLIADYIKKRFKDDFLLLGPDEESTQWNTPIAKLLKKPVTILKKTRVSANKVSVSKEHLTKHYILIVDDIISTGHTLVEALKEAKQQGAKKLVCIGIHGVLAKGAAERITRYAELITTNTIPNKYAKIDVSPAIVQALKKEILA